MQLDKIFTESLIHLTFHKVVIFKRLPAGFAFFGDGSPSLADGAVSTF